MPDRLWTPAFIAVGSNLDGPRRRVEQACESLAGLDDTRWVATSPLYGSKPMGPKDQPDYVNAVVAVLTRLGPEALLGALLALETRLGRRQDGHKWGPRHIDLDLLLHGDNVRGDNVGEGQLRLPHPGLCDRAFVLQPLMDLAPALRLPDGRRIGGLIEDIDCSEVWQL